ncbi:MAG TPA: hypothetical protein VFA26_17575 [Gemmataceae bacterium]|nr:hypothetical protein [Gemmataceae bacterium]
MNFLRGEAEFARPGPSPAEGRACARRGLALHQAGDFAAALAEYDRALRLAPAEADTLCRRALARLGRTDPADAAAAEDDTLRLDPRGAWACFTAAPRPAADALAAALADLNAALALDPAHPASLLCRALVRRALGEHATARADLQTLLRPDPADGEGHGLRGLARLAVGDAPGARNDLDAAVNAGWRTAASHLSRARARLALGDSAGALADCDEALCLAQDYAPALNLRGVVRQARGNLPGALADFDAALRLRPGLASAHGNRAGARLARGDTAEPAAAGKEPSYLERALADCDEAIRLEPGRAVLYANRARLRHAAGQGEEAVLADCDMALSLAPADAWTLCVRGSVRAARGNNEAAAADFRRALRADPRFAAVLEAEGRPADGEADGCFIAVAPAATPRSPALGRPVGEVIRAALRAGLCMLAAALLGAAVGALVPLVPELPLTVASWGLWLLGWAVLGCLGSVLGGASHLGTLTNYLGRGWANAGWPRRAGGSRRRGLAQAACLALSVALPAVGRGAGGALTGICVGTLTAWLHDSGVAALLMGALWGLGAGIELGARFARGRKGWRVAAALGGLAAGPALSAVLGWLLPGLVAGAYAAHVLARQAAEAHAGEGAPQRRRPWLRGLCLLAVAAGAAGGVADLEETYRVIGTGVASALPWSVGGALVGALLGGWFGLTFPNRTPYGPLSARLLDGTSPGDGPGARARVGLLLASAGALLGGSVGLFAGLVLSVLSAALGQANAGPAAWVAGGAALGALAAALHATRSLRCRPLLGDRTPVEMIVPLPPLPAGLLVLAGAGLGALGGLLLAALGGGAFWMIAGAGIGAVIGGKLWAVADAG